MRGVRSLVRRVLAAVVLFAAARCPGAQAPLPATRAPLVGISCKFTKGSAGVSLAYARAVREAGGVPVLLPMLDDERLIAQYVRYLDGLVLSGGLDVPPQAYGEKPHPTVKPLPPERWRFERRLVAAWLQGRKPLLGICLGAQMANVVLGGSLVQDIPSHVGTAVVHRRKGGAAHEVVIEPGSRLRRILGVGRAEVNSNHHQAVQRLGKGLRVAARAPDGVVEALEGAGARWLLLVQWHPERAGAEHRQAIFGDFVRHCGPAAGPARERPPPQAPRGPRL